MKRYRILAGSKGTYLQHDHGHVHCTPMKFPEMSLDPREWSLVEDDGRTVTFRSTISDSRNREQYSQITVAVSAVVVTYNAR